MTIPPDPFTDGGLPAFARRLRSGNVSAEETVAACLDRIEALEPSLNAFEHLAGESALASARALDRTLAAGIDLGPLMGVPVAVKDLIAVEGMPTTAGSNVDVSDLIGTEGGFVRRMRQAGCVIVGKTRTVEFALGGAGTNQVRGTPINPWDGAVPRAPGGSSSGSAVAAAARMCRIAIGSDTGGSVRGPAAFCGAFGLKTSKSLWPTDGVYPLSPTLDTLGPLTSTAADAAWFLAGYHGTRPVQPAPVRGLRLGRPANYFFDDLEPEVARSCDAALEVLALAGIAIVESDVPEAGMDTPWFYDLVVAEFLECLGRERFVRNLNRIDRDVADWGMTGVGMPADRYVQALERHRLLCCLADERFAGLDGILSPTRPITAPPLAAFDDAEEYRRLASVMARNTRFGNMSGVCASSTPIHQLGSDLPVGLMLTGPAGTDAGLMSIALTLEEILGPPSEPDLFAFAAHA